MSLQSPLGRVLGFGTAREGTRTWWAERVSSVALVPLTLWFLFSLLLLPSLEFDVVRAWLAGPTTALLCILLVGVSAHHAYLGMSVIVEDYVHGHAAKLLLLLTLRFLYVLCAGAGILAVLRIALGPA